MFQPVSSRVSFPELEERILQFWRERDIFRKSIEQRPDDNMFVFYEGPPTANALPGVHHVLGRVFKDCIPRYKTMRGYRVPRKGGWDTHGLPVELEVEKALGLRSKPEIETFGIEEFNRRCRESVFRYVREWEELTERIGFWIDMENAYVTLDNSYIETCWWIIKTLWERRLVYLDYRVTPHCPRCGTSLADHEVAQGYKEDTPDPSLFVKFRVQANGQANAELRLDEGIPTYLLAWTTTPWTLPGNTALAVSPEFEYALVEVSAADGGQSTERLVLAAALVEPVLSGAEGAAPANARVLARFPGQRLVGLTYEPLFRPEDWGQEVLAFRDGRLTQVKPADRHKPVRRVIAGDFVSLSEGTGIVHIAPAYGAEDFEAGRREGLLFVQTVDARGEMTEATPWAGRFVKDADPLIIDDLKQRGLVLRSETYYHTYPFCWRCDTPLLYYAKPTWYIRTTAIKDRLVNGNNEINWYPDYIKHGRFGDWLRNNIDWALSRERYWGTPLPIWRCDLCADSVCIGSVAELRERARDKAQVDALTDLHRPYVDEITFSCANCGGTMRRVPEVIDVWFDSGAMPYAQWHYPFENRETFERMFPADFICEAVDQTRGWFYTLHAEAELLFGSICYRNVICHGHIQDEQGRKMSKSLGNTVDPWTVIRERGADALRWYMLTASAPGNPRRFSSNLVGEVVRKFMLTLWNVYSFFVTYALIDRFDPGQPPVPVSERAELDRWVLSELNALVEKATNLLDDYNPTDAGRAIEAFVDDLSNWYVRRSRRRFWKSEDDTDKLAAHQTLYTCLVTLARLIAPFTPFMAEAMYQNLVRSWDASAPESVHLCDWPQADTSLIDAELSADMRLAMRVASLSRAARSKASIKVRQPLQKMLVRVPTPAAAAGLRRLTDTVASEANVRQIEVTTEAIPAGYGVAVTEAELSLALDTELTPDLVDEGLARELVRRLQNMRRSAGFDIADHIVTYYRGDETVQRVFERFGDYIGQETLSAQMLNAEPPDGAYVEQQRVDGTQVTLAVRRV